jgi:hypothetical protein
MKNSTDKKLLTIVFWHILESDLYFLVTVVHIAPSRSENQAGFHFSPISFFEAIASFRKYTVL